MIRNIRYVICGMMLCSLLSCIKNDLSYPDVVPGVSSFEVEGQKSVNISQDSCIVDIVLDENADISHVKVVSYSFSNSPELLGSIPEYLDLREPFTFTIRLYGDYRWTVRASQPISRYIDCDNQVGKADINVKEKLAYVYVTENQPLSSIRINDMKLEPEGSVVDSTLGFIYQPNPEGYGGKNVAQKLKCSFPMVLDCVLQRYFYVRYEGERIEWRVVFLQKAVSMEVSSVNAWTYSAEVEAVTDGKGTPVLEYRKTEDPDWTSVPVSSASTTVSQTIEGLEPSTGYLVRVSNGIGSSESYPFMTGDAAQVENMDFDGWHQADPNNCWYPWKEGFEPVWGNANPGVNIAGPVNPTRPDYTHVVTAGGAAARLESVTAFGVFAAGNLFTGSFEKFASMTAYLSWGTPFSSRPYSMKGYYDYSPALVNKAKEPFLDMKGKPDYMQILVALFADGDGEGEKGPFPVDSSKPGQPDLKTDPRVIAYGVVESNEDTGGNYREFECVLEYRDDRTPDYVIVTACSSLKGDYFTGGLGSVLYVDDFSFSYR